MSDQAAGAPGGAGHEHGSIGEEATKLAGAVQTWLGEWRSQSGRAGGSAKDVWATATQPSDDGAECRVCPVCQALRVLRTTRPETFEHLSDAAASLAAALRGLIGEPGDRPTGQRPPGVERIDLG